MKKEMNGLLLYFAFLFSISFVFGGTYTGLEIGNFTGSSHAVTLAGADSCIAMPYEGLLDGKAGDPHMGCEWDGASTINDVSNKGWAHCSYICRDTTTPLNNIIDINFVNEVFAGESVGTDIGAGRDCVTFMSDVTRTSSFGGGNGYYYCNYNSDTGNVTASCQGACSGLRCGYFCVDGAGGGMDVEVVQNTMYNPALSSNYPIEDPFDDGVYNAGSGRSCYSIIRDANSRYNYGLEGWCNYNSTNGNIEYFASAIDLSCNYICPSGSTCSPSITCNDYASIGVCGQNLDDGCEETLNCPCGCDDGIDNDGDGGVDSLTEATGGGGGSLLNYYSRYINRRKDVPGSTGAGCSDPKVIASNTDWYSFNDFDPSATLFLEDITGSYNDGVNDIDCRTGAGGVGQIPQVTFYDAVGTQIGPTYTFDVLETTGVSIPAGTEQIKANIVDSNGDCWDNSGGCNVFVATYSGGGGGAVTECNDGLNNSDGDGKWDFCTGTNPDTCDSGCASLEDVSEDPHDVGCADPTDASEYGVTECDDGLDNDGDGFCDFNSNPSYTCSDGSFPGDIKCAQESQVDESTAPPMPSVNYWTDMAGRQLVGSHRNVTIGSYVKLMSDHTFGPDIDLYRGGADTGVDVGELLWRVTTSSGNIDVGDEIDFVSSTGTSEDPINITNSGEDSPMNVTILNPHCGEDIEAMQPYPIFIQLEDKDSLITASLRIDNTEVGVFDNRVSNTTLFNFNFDRAGNIPITLLANNSDGEKKLVSLTVMVIDTSSTETDFYVASCIDKPKNFEKFTSPRVDFNASGSKGLKYVPTGPGTYTLEDITDPGDLFFHWKFYHEGELVGECSGLGDESCPGSGGEGTVMAFTRGFSTVNDNSVNLLVRVADHVISP